jgi:hypothetical protein
MGQNQHYSLSVQQQLSSKTVFDIAYVGNHGLHLQATDDFNDPSPAAGAVQGRRPFQPWGAITFQSQDLGTTYQALQTKLERRVTDGITGLISYTWSKFMQSNQSPVLSFQHAPKPGAERKLSTAGGAWQKIHGQQQSFCGCSAWRMARPDHYCAAEWNTVYACCFHRQGEYRRRKPATEHKPSRRITHFPKVLVELV